MNLLQYQQISAGRSAPVKPWPPPPRAPLPHFDPATWESPDDSTAPSWHPVFTDLIQTPPSNPDLRWWRGNAWGITVPGLPLVPGSAPAGTPAAERVLSYFFGRYRRAGGQAMAQRILDTTWAAGCTHFSLSPQDEFAEGMSLSEYVQMSEEVKRAGFFVHHLLRSKYYTAPDPNFHDAQVVGEALIAAGVADVFTPAWEMNYWSPEVCRQMIDFDANWIQGRVRNMLHFFPHYISWQLPSEHPHDFWTQNVGKTQGVLYQCEPTWTVGMMSARVQDCLARLIAGGVWGLPQSFDFTAWETIATQQYINGQTGNGRPADETIGDLCGYELCCVPGPMPVLGFGNGGRRPDGSAL